ncbi:tRNA (adenosine(37)-N6)-dimethylallyltransferase MiaA [Sphingomonas sp. CBMAI 2297]|uniref:tRNA (adenosine(37)-N6)-dimethylallyltransferase MiaA n=1 Tax=Sphingomonas sp. CBMAI 2297 TaxID=2991720 RepID=UPI0024569289|nr:tRNA (adenosine(37)-N6)-dimethylallyltransferase MiaA [Sphingomonas sp. CBMAI 2297]MDH4743194.1 tRNA (adenosine(37)-N6)-dimethylallyltransferase MiaA [Sphingomonas sp. CBMAI 2297]
MNIGSPDLPLVALIAGPTASGKSALALALAEKHGGVVINADSMQVYADLRVLTARPSAEEEKRAPHRLFGHVDGAEAYSAARWAAEARCAIAEAHAAGRLPILVGGTGMYLRTLVEGIAPVPEIDPEIRAAVRAMAVADAHAELSRHDPETAARLKPADTARVSRALEVVRSTGKSLGTWQAERHGGIGGEVRIAALILLPDKTWLADRIDRRFRHMVQVARKEVEALLARTDIPDDAPVLRAIGVREIGLALSGESNMDEAHFAGSLATRQYAKRQYTWFRRQPPPEWERTNETQTNRLIEQFETKLL